MIQYETHEVLSHFLTAEGAQVLKDGSHEARVWSVLSFKGQGKPITPVELKKKIGDETSKVGQGRAFKNGWIAKEGDGLVKIVRLRNLPYIDFDLTLVGLRSRKFKTPLRAICKKLHLPEP
jgi:hypothetical protein